MLSSSLWYGSADLWSIMTLKASSRAALWCSRFWPLLPTFGIAQWVSAGLWDLLFWCAICSILGRWHICCQACSVSSFVWIHYHDFGVIDPPFGARVFVVQMAICGTKTHLASIKKWYFCCWYYLPIFLDQSSDLSTSWLVDWVKSVVWSVSQFWHELKLTYWPANLLNKATQKSKDIEGREEKLVCQSEKLISFRQKTLKLLAKAYKLFVNYL